MHLPSRHICFLTLLAPLLAAGCVSSKDDAGTSLAYEQTADLALPESVAILPEIAPGERAYLVASAIDAEAPAEAAYTAIPASAADRAAGLAAAQPEKPAFEPAGAATPVAQPAVLVAKGAQAEAAPVVAAAYVVPDKPRSSLDELIEKYAALYEVPVVLVRRVVRRESNFNPAAYNRGHWGLMQIKHATARGMGYDGPARGLLDAETNLKYAVKYLRGAFMVAAGDHDRADRLYQRGYYYDAKRLGLLDETGLGRDRPRKRGV